MKLLVTGGAGFIGSNFIRHVLATHPDDTVVNLDKLTYTSNEGTAPSNLADLDGNPRHIFRRGDICNAADVRDVMPGVDAVVNFAAWTHVDRAILDPSDALHANVLGVFTLLEAIRELKIPRFLHISTDEVYGSVEVGASREDTALKPRNPYSASKASADLLIGSYCNTYGTPGVITRSSNNFGPYQHPEKVIPLFITNAFDDASLPLYGEGKNVRDWLYVIDNCTAIDLVLRKGRDGEIYNIGGGNEVRNVDLTTQILRLTGKPESLVRRVQDRPGHDLRYAVDCRKVRALGWAPRHGFAEALATTVDWYRRHEAWWRPLKSGEFKAYYQQQYAHR